MTTRPAAALLAVLGLALAASQAEAQAPYAPPIQPNPYRRPAVSPYLNLLRGGSAGVNYYALVVPQQEATRSITQLQQLANTPYGGNVAFEDGSAGVQAGSGHVWFQNHYGFFLTTRPGATSAAGLTSPAGATGVTPLAPGILGR